MRPPALAKIVVSSLRPPRVLGAATVALALSWLAPAGCSTSSPYTDPCPDADDALTIGGYCDQLLPTFCAYAVGTCGVSGTVESCVANARPTCCQGTCSRHVCPVDPLALDTCLKRYAGPDAGLATGGDGGEIDGSVAVDAGSTCQEVTVGLAPAACQSLIVLR